MPFTPIQFADFSKQYSDLATKQMKDEDFVNKLTIKRTAAHGLKIETSATSGVGIDGNLKLSWKCAKTKSEYEVSDDTKGKLKAKVKANDLAKGVLVTLEPSHSNGLLSGKATVDYKHENFCGSAELKLDETVDKDNKRDFKHSCSISGAAGMDGVSVGAKLDCSNGKFGDFNMGMHYAEDDFQFAMITATENKKPVVRATFFQQVSADLQSGFQFNSPSNVVTLASQLKLDKVTTVKATIDTQGLVNAALQHTLSNPRAQLNLATQFKTTNGLSQYKMEKYGFNWTVGDL